MFDFDDLDDEEEAAAKTAADERLAREAAEAAKKSEEERLRKESDEAARKAQEQRAKEAAEAAKRAAEAAKKAEEEQSAKRAAEAAKKAEEERLAKEAAEASKPPSEHANARYSSGMILESVATTIMRAAEDMDSDIVLRLAANSLVQVLEIGTGPTGKRVRVRARAGGEEGWVSVIAQNGSLLFKAGAADSTPAQEVQQAEDRRKKEQQEAQDRQKRDQDRAAEEERRRRRELEEQREAERRREAEDSARRQQASASSPASLFNVGDVCKCKSLVLMRQLESLSAAGNSVVGRLVADDELEILQIGTDPSGKRIKVKDQKGNQGWVSALSSDGSQLLDVTRVAEQADLFKGTGQALGGGSPTAGNPRAAALAAAERRHASAMSHGVGEEKAKQLRESSQREAMLKKITEVYSKKKEDVPISLGSANLEALQKHWDHLQRPVEPVSKPEPAPRPAPARPSPAVTSLAPVGGPMQTPQMPATGGVQGSQEQRELLLQEAMVTYNLTARQLEALESLELLGFELPLALEAFLACDRNQELAANYLIESQANLEAPMPAGSSITLPPGVDPMAFGLTRLPPVFPGPAPADVGLQASDREAVRRLEELGFDRPTALKAFFACGRDEEMAANRLLV
eukprot:TRINITY_DN5227_c0_g2_i1.p1 TRINITY_DN5227_c0_g2~~TRINITY_DN5227_c0_g2_i1.p1  ORF type:complete len:631 (+),score=176.81 TRINITY_DN5227_c0_g2_i1:76-1968(+)